MDTITFSVIIPAYNSEATISRVLEALRIQTLRPLEVIVVDDGSTDRTAEIVRSFSEARYVFQENRGPAAARNRGAHEARGGILAFTDSDCRPQSDWLERLAEGFFEADIAAVAGSYGIINSESLLARCIHREILYRHRWLMPDYPRVFGSYNVAIRLDVFTQVRGFEESYRHASGEDNDLSYKILATGRRIYFQRQAVVDHRHPWRLRTYLREQFRHGYWRVQIYRRYPKMMRGDGYTFWKDIVEALMALLIFVSPAFFLFLPISTGIWISSGLIMVLGILEIVFAFVIGASVSERGLLPVMMFLRSFARAFGFVNGLLTRVVRSA